MSTGVEEIDSQHIQLVEMLNRLYKSMKDGNGEVECNNTMTQLFEYTATHFKNEENLMSLHRYPDIEKHVAEHSRLLQEATRINEKKIKTSFELMIFLKSWLVNHIMEVDLELGKHLKSMGV